MSTRNCWKKSIKHFLFLFQFAKFSREANKFHRYDNDLENFSPVVSSSRPLLRICLSKTRRYSPHFDVNWCSNIWIDLDESQQLFSKLNSSLWGAGKTILFTVYSFPYPRSRLYSEEHERFNFISTRSSINKQLFPTPESRLIYF